MLYRTFYSLSGIGANRAPGALVEQLQSSLDGCGSIDQANTLLLVIGQLQLIVSSITLGF